MKRGLHLGGILLQQTCDGMDWLAELQFHRQLSWLEYKERKERQQAYEERETLRLLARHKLLETKRVGEKLMVRLTGRGWQQALRDKIRCTDKKCRDGECIIVIFDVPESEKLARHALRLVLSQCGFTMLQKSVWVTRKEVLKELCALLQGAKLEQWVRVLRAIEMNLNIINRLAIRARFTHISH